MKRYTVLRSRDRDFRHEWDGPVLSISPHEWVLVHRAGFLGNGPVSSNIFGRNERKINSQRSSWSKVTSPKKIIQCGKIVTQTSLDLVVHAMLLIVCGVGWALFIFWVSEHHTTTLGIKKKRWGLPCKGEDGCWGCHDWAGLAIIIEGPEFILTVYQDLTKHLKKYAF